MKQNIYLGISGVCSHDSAAALIVAGKVIAAAEEERFTREKHTGKFPYSAIDFCLSYAGIKPEEVDCVAYYFDPRQRYFPSLRFNAITAIPKAKHILTHEGSFKGVFNAFRNAAQVERLIIQGCSETKRVARQKFRNAEFRSVRHHDAHAASAFYVSPFEQSSVLTIDLIGEWDTTSFYSGKGSKLQRIDSISFPHSLGKFYQTFTKFLGFKPNSDEYKVMGLAAYGSDRFVPFFQSMYALQSNGKFTLNPEFLLFCKGIRPEWDEHITSVLGQPRQPEETLTEEHKDIAYAIQKAAEEIELHVVRNLIAKTGKKNLCMAGGVALNALANQKIRESELVDRLFVQPASNDAGASIGAALHAYFSDNPASERTPMEHCYLGPEYTSADAHKAAEGTTFQIFEGDVYSRAADLLAQGKVVGLFHGRMEFGPRALGNRSILADPRQASMKDTVNAKIKFRESFRPFAPAILEEEVSKYFANGVPSRFMTQTFSATELAQCSTPATVHEDRTARIQTVTQAYNPIFHRLIKMFEDRTGVPVLLNTSFNVAGEPIVCTPADAIRTFTNSGIDALLLEDLLLEK